MLTSEVLYTAADLIERRGWAAGEGWQDNGYGPLCLEGGIAAAMGERDGAGLRCPAYDAVRDYLGDESPWLWNDQLKYLPHGGWVGGSREAAERLAAETVIATLRAAAVIEAAKEAPTARILGGLDWHGRPVPASGER